MCDLKVLIAQSYTVRGTNFRQNATDVQKTSVLGIRPSQRSAMASQAYVEISYILAHCQIQLPYQIV